MREDLAALGKEPADILRFNEFNAQIWPTIKNLDLLRDDLGELDGVLKSIDVKDPGRLKQALDVTIRARRHLAGIPDELARTRKDVLEFLRDEDSVNQSKALRQAIERAILIRLQRFDDSKNRFLNAAQAAAKDPNDLGNLASLEKEAQAYDELTQLFTQLFRNLHNFDAIEAKAGPRPEADDRFATLAQKLLGQSPVDAQPRAVGQQPAAAPPPAAVPAEPPHGRPPNSHRPPISTRPPQASKPRLKDRRRRLWSAAKRPALPATPGRDQSRPPRSPERA